MTRQRNGDKEGEKKKMSFVMQGKKLAARIFLPSIFFLSYFSFSKYFFLFFSLGTVFFYSSHIQKSAKGKGDRCRR